MNSFLGQFNCLNNLNENEEKKTEDKSSVNENENDIDENANIKKKLVIRPGDWICGYCHNLNFAFRIACNRCRMSKFYWY